MEEWNRTVAAFTGAIKDAMGEAGENVMSPILANPDFERLEAEGREMLRARRDAEGPKEKGE